MALYRLLYISLTGVDAVYINDIESESLYQLEPHFRFTFSLPVHAVAHETNRTFTIGSFELVYALLCSCELRAHAFMFSCAIIH